MQIFSFSVFGYEGALVTVEVDLRRGIPAVDVVGLADGAVKESRERMRSAIRNSGYDFPPERVLISLSPADLRKEGAGFDLAIALAVLKAKQDFESDIGGVLVMGELELNGRVRPVRGVHAAVSTAYESGISYCIVPKENEEEAREIKDMKVFGASSLTEAFESLQKSESFISSASCNPNLVDDTLPQGSVCIDGVYFAKVESDTEYLEVKNQAYLIRGLQIAAAGGHNLLAYGPPGCGKSLALQKFSGLLPLLTVEEAQSVTRIYSIASLLPAGTPLIRIPPFRMPHQTATIEGICGGGAKCGPGEISLAHNGVLFLDEAAEYRTSVLQMLRVPLESGSITLSRAGRTTVYPARFQLIMATNPCPCGFYGSRDRLCLCSSRAVEMYWKKFSGPLLDRIDIRIHVERRDSGSEAVSTEALRKNIARAVNIQRLRQQKRNAYLSPCEIQEYCIMTDEAKSYLEEESERFELSARAVSGCMKLARTISDMAAKEIIDTDSIVEAIGYRKNSVGLDIEYL